MVIFFKVLAVILAGIAAYFLWAGNNDGLFVAAVFASVSFFLSVRFEVKARNERREAERELAESLHSGQLEEISNLTEIQTNNEQRTTDKGQITKDKPQ